MVFTEKMLEIKKELKKLDHEVFVSVCEANFG